VRHGGGKMFVELGGDYEGGINTDNIFSMGDVQYLDRSFCYWFGIRMVGARSPDDDLSGASFKTEQEAIAKRNEIIEAINGECCCKNMPASQNEDEWIDMFNLHVSGTYEEHIRVLRSAVSALSEPSPDEDNKGNFCFYICTEESLVVIEEGFNLEQLKYKYSFKTEEEAKVAYWGITGEMP